MSTPNLPRFNPNATAEPDREIFTDYIRRRNDERRARARRALRLHAIAWLAIGLGLGILAGRLLP